MNTLPTSPQIDCPELPEFNSADLDSAIQAFQTAPVCTLRQAWRTEVEKNFAPATVRVGWQGQCMLFLAELKDADIFTFARHPNERLWELGDTLEIFLRPVDQSAYAEFHIAPNNRQLQLRYSNAAAVQQSRLTGSLGDALVPDMEFESRTWVFPERSQWYVLAKIPVLAVTQKLISLPGPSWLFSVSRYDYTRGSANPVLSSTSAHSQPDFHRQAEWGTLRFQKGQPGLKSGQAAELAGRNHNC